jgi:hypothetical protein
MRGLTNSGWEGGRWRKWGKGLIFGQCGLDEGNEAVFDVLRLVNFRK